LPWHVRKLDRCPPLCNAGSECEQPVCRGRTGCLGDNAPRFAQFRGVDPHNGLQVWGLVVDIHRGSEIMSVRAGVFSWDLDGREKVVSRGSQAGQAEDEEGPRAKLSQYPATTHKRPARRPLMCHSGRYREMRGAGDRRRRRRSSLLILML